MLSCHYEPFLAFARDLQLYGCEVHLYRGPNVFGQILGDNDFPQPSWWETENTYFLAGVKKGLAKRASDSDVKWRGMFTLDFDIRKELEKAQIKTSVELMTEEILEKLNAHPTWSKYRYVVMSGNGMHVHYFGEPVEVNKEQWVAGMRDVFDEINAITPIPCDTGCGNAGRIMRLPGSWNVKDPKNKRPVPIEIWEPKNACPPLRFVQERGAVAIARREERKAAEKADFEARNPEGGSDVVDLINQIPVEQVVGQLFKGVKVRAVKKDGGLRFADSDGTERGFFKHKDFNVIVHEGTSLFPVPDGKGYNPLGLVKVVLGMNAHDAIQWFAERSAPVRDAIAREKEEWARENETHEILGVEEKLSSAQTNA